MRFNPESPSSPVVPSGRDSAVEGREPPRIAVIGAGIAGAACAAGLLQAGFDVTVFDKSKGVGGRLATRRATWLDAGGRANPVAFDHGCPHFTAKRPRFRALVDRVVAQGGACRWYPRIHAPFPAPLRHEVIVPTPDLPTFCTHLLHGVPLRLGHAVTAVDRGPGGWWLQASGQRPEGPFERVVMAIPAAQAAALLRPHHDDWADALAGVPMAPCWTLMAVTDDVDWPWDAAVIERGELAWIARQDGVPGRFRGSAVPWVAHATAAWSLEHLEDDPAAVLDVLGAALGRLLTGGDGPRRHHAAVHRWRHAQRADATTVGASHWNRDGTGLSVCGDAFGDGSVEAAWSSGDDLASSLIASFRARVAAAVAPRSGSTASSPPRRARRRAPPLSLNDPQPGDSRWAPPDAPF